MRKNSQEEQARKKTMNGRLIKKRSEDRMNPSKNFNTQMMKTSKGRNLKHSKKKRKRNSRGTNK